MDRLGTHRTRSAGFGPTSATSLLSEFSSPLPHFSLVQGDDMQNAGFVGMMLNCFELALANLQLGCLTMVCKSLTALSVGFS